MLKSFFLLVVMIMCSCSSHKNHSHHHRFDDAEKWSEIFEDDKRESWQNSKKVISTVGVRSNSIVADIGSATGFFPVRVAKIARKGRVWGIDIEPTLINFLNKRARNEGIKNLYSILGTFNDPLIPEKVDFIFIVDTYHHISDREVYFKRLRNSLKPGGKIVIIDFKKGKLPFGPKDHAKLTKEQIKNEMNSAGYHLFEDHSFLKYQYFLIFE